MIKLSFLIIGLLFYSFLCAQDTPVSPLDLGDVIIEGESDLIKDSLGTNYDLDSLLNVEDKDKFLYKPEPVLETASDNNMYDRSRLLSLEVKGGNYIFGSVKAVLSASSILNFNLNLYNRSLKKDWNILAGDLNWLPTWKSLDFNLGVEYLEYRSPQIDTEAQNISLGISHPAFTIADKFNMPSIDLSLIYYQITQGKVDFNSFDIRSGINWESDILKLTSHLEYLKDHLQGDAALYFKKLPINKLGLYVHYKPELYGDSAKLRLSIDFYNRIKLHESLFLNLSNEPYLTKNSFLDDLKAYKYQEFSENSNQYSALLNPSFSLEYFGPLYVKGSYRFSVCNDYYIFVPDSSGIDQLVRHIRVDQQEAGLDVVYKFGVLEAANNFTYKSYEVNESTSTDQLSEDYAVNIPYVPEIINLTSLRISYSAWSLKFENKFLSGREDEFGKQLDDLNLINVYLSYKLLDQLDIIGEVENVLAQKYTTASYLPEEDLQFKAGFRWSF